MQHVKEVYVVRHVHGEDTDDEDVKFIGVYRSRETADAAVARLSKQPGFCDWPDGFHIGRYELDKDHWTEGFITVLPGEEL
jgi:hypothetical protein